MSEWVGGWVGGCGRGRGRGSNRYDNFLSIIQIHLIDNLDNRLIHSEQSAVIDCLVGT